MKHTIGQKHPKNQSPKLKKLILKNPTFSRTIMANLLCGALPWKNLLYGGQTLGHLLPRFILVVVAWKETPALLEISRFTDAPTQMDYLIT